jgi:hypothetical protein
MSEMALIQALDQLVPECSDAHGEWEDVLRRAGMAPAEAPTRPGRRWLTRRRTLALVLVAVVLAILLATPAYGLLRDLFGRIDLPFGSAKPAPHQMKQNFSDFSRGAPSGMDPRAIASETRQIHVFRGADGRHVLYVAPTRQGGFCEWFTNAVAGCRATRTSIDSPLNLSYSEHGTIKGGPEFADAVGGDLITEDAADVVVEYEDGTKTPLMFVFVSKPIDAGFFFYAIPPGHSARGTRVIAVSVRDADGRVIARQSIPYPDLIQPYAIPKHPKNFPGNPRP